MQSRESPSSKQDPQGLNKYVSQVLDYVVDRFAQGQKEVIPSLAAEKLKLSSVEILGLFMLLEDKGILQHFYRVYCRNKDAPLCDVADKEDIPEQIPCKFCGDEHGEIDVDVEVVFRINAEKLTDLLRKRAVA